MRGCCGIQWGIVTEPDAAAGPLTDLRVLDLAGEAGVFTGRQLAEMGAEVIRIEPPGGDGVRRRSPFLDGEAGVEHSLYHQHFNVNKRGVTLDFRRSEGAALLRRLAAVADVLIETCAPGEMDRLGVGYEALRELNAGLIYVTITPFGQQGPMRDYRANDLVSVAMSGLMYLNGYPEDPPNMPGAEQAYHMGAVAATTGTLIALAGRDRDQQGRGRRVDVSLQEAASMATLQTANANHYTWHRQIPIRHGLMGAAGGRSIFQCRDQGWVSFVVPPPFWDAFVEWIEEEGIENALAGEEWHDPAYRLEHAGETDEAIEQLAARFDKSALFHEGQRRRLLVMPVNTVENLLADEQIREREFFVSVRHPELDRTLTHSGVPYHMSRTPAAVTRRAPLLGEHNHEVYCDLLGLSDAELGDLRAEGVV